MFENQIILYCDICAKPFVDSDSNTREKIGRSALANGWIREDSLMFCSMNCHLDHILKKKGTTSFHGNHRTFSGGNRYTLDAAIAEEQIRKDSNENDFKNGYMLNREMTRMVVDGYKSMVDNAEIAACRYSEMLECAEERIVGLIISRREAEARRVEAMVAVEKHRARYHRLVAWLRDLVSESYGVISGVEKEVNISAESSVMKCDIKHVRRWRDVIEGNGAPVCSGDIFGDD